MCFDGKQLSFLGVILLLLLFVTRRCAVVYDVILLLLLFVTRRCAVVYDVILLLMLLLLLLFVTRRCAVVYDVILLLMLFVTRRSVVSEQRHVVGVFQDASAATSRLVRRHRVHRRRRRPASRRGRIAAASGTEHPAELARIPAGSTMFPGHANE